MGSSEPPDLANKLLPEADAVARLFDTLSLNAAECAAIEDEAVALVIATRQRSDDQSMLDVFMQEYGLANEEGVALMCLAESLLRVPDANTVDALIADKLAGRDWEAHEGQSDSLFIDASTWGLMLTGKLLESGSEYGFMQALTRAAARLGEPVIRAAVRQAMVILGNEFVLGRTIDSAIERGHELGGVYSFDMLGEGARTQAVAERYCAAYETAIRRVGSDAGGSSISVKLSALHPRYEFAQWDRVVSELYPRLKGLATAAAQVDCGFSIDAEEADRLNLSLGLFDRLARCDALAGWNGLSFVVQAYGKRALDLIDHLATLAADTGRVIPVRLVKGAYWDAEIKHAQVEGLDDFPVYTRKAGTDVSYLACAERLVRHRKYLAPQFATHNAHTLVAARHIARDCNYEFQRLHGMGELLYSVAGERYPDLAPVRVYAPVGEHEDLLAYLVRRLLENGANASFVNRFLDRNLEPRQVVRDPVSDLRQYPRSPRIKRPEHAGSASVLRAQGADLTATTTVHRLYSALAAAADRSHDIGADPTLPNTNPATGASIGKTAISTPAQIDAAMVAAAQAQPAWDALGGDKRAEVLERAADHLRAQRDELIALTVLEAGKTLPDAVAEVREAEDFCRYYAHYARKDFTTPEVLPGPTGERNQLTLHGRGVFACISPWNFPLAICAGQITAALAAGNTVVAKPAEQTPAVAARFVELLHQAGVPAPAVQCVYGPGAEIGTALLSHKALGGVAFTGGTATAKIIQRQLAQRDGPIVPLIAETGGQNAMIVDSTALLEQMTDDVMTSAFASAGQRCSALRVLCLQADIADTALELIVGAMDELRVGDPRRLKTDVGPVIDAGARDRLLKHIADFTAKGRLIHALDAPKDSGFWVPPHLLRLDTIGELDQEHFGPILHIVTWQADALDALLNDIDATGYGLTLGIHTRMDERVHAITQRLRIGNTYVNRSTTGAMVGVQPFGGERLSGTGPKAGGPRYLHRFAVERTVSVNLMASGGDVELLRG